MDITNHAKPRKIRKKKYLEDQFYWNQFFLLENYDHGDAWNF